MKRNLARVILISAGAIWGIGFVANKYVLDHGWQESQLIFVRFFTATLLIFLVFAKRIIKTDKRTVLSGLFLGIFLYLGFFFQTWGLKHTSASNNALITAGYIVMLPVIVFAFERTRVPKKTILAGITTLVGIALITVDFKNISHIASGDYLTFIGAFFFGLHIYFLGRLARRTDLYVLMAFQLLAFCIISSLVMFLGAGLPSVDWTSSIDISVIAIAILMGAFGSFLAFVMQSVGQKYTNASEAAILISTESLFGPLFAILFYKEAFDLPFLFGMILVLSGIVLSEIDLRNFRKNRFVLAENGDLDDRSEEAPV